MWYRYKCILWYWMISTPWNEIKSRNWNFQEGWDWLWFDGSWRFLSRVPVRRNVKKMTTGVGTTLANIALLSTEIDKTAFRKLRKKGNLIWQRSSGGCFIWQVLIDSEMEVAQEAVILGTHTANNPSISEMCSILSPRTRNYYHHNH